MLLMLITLHVIQESMYINGSFTIAVFTLLVLTGKAAIKKRSPKG